MKVLPIKADDVQSAVRTVEKNSGLFYIQQNLILERESLPCSDSPCPTVRLKLCCVWFLLVHVVLVFSNNYWSHSSFKKW